MSSRHRDGITARADTRWPGRQLLNRDAAGLGAVEWLPRSRAGYPFRRGVVALFSKPTNRLRAGVGSLPHARVSWFIRRQARRWAPFAIH